ncbi:MAG: 16S rRNA (cytosine(1402)-N(4))-methyltransferase [Ignavibacteria bacterium]
MTDSFHTPVLLDDVLRFLLTKTTGVYVDGTVGGGGHAESICKKLDPDACFIGFDADEDAIRATRERLRDVKPRVRLVHANVEKLKEELQKHSVASMTGFFLDLGVSSHQLDDASKGFSFRGNERIDMRMDRRQELDGWYVVNQYREEELARIVRVYGEEHQARRIARAIVHARPLNTTGELAEVVEKTVGWRFLTKTLARVFQAIRIEVNDELNALNRALHDAIELMEPGGRLVVISYHSLEDRVVKTMLREAAARSRASGHKYVPDLRLEPKLRLLTKRPVTPSNNEVLGNPRARSAKLRAAERL